MFMEGNLGDICIDRLTGLVNETYIKQNYHEYIYKHPNARYIMIDFTKFKLINDAYGHEVGDRCLKLFADYIIKFFKDSIVSRLHGDEYVIITDYSEERVRKLFDIIDMSLQGEAKIGFIPVKFDFNAGDCPCYEDLVETAKRADYMMYYAKANRLRYVPYKDEIYNEKLEKESLSRTLKEHLSNQGFSYYGRKLYYKNGDPTDYSYIYTKDANGNPFFSDKMYQAIKDSCEISKFDAYNIRVLIEMLSMTSNPEKFFVNVDYKSMLAIDELHPFFHDIRLNTINGLSNIVASIDVSGIEPSRYDSVIDLLHELHKFDIPFCLDKVSSKVANYLLFAANPQYIKVAYDSWKNAMYCPRRKEIFQSMVDTYQKAGCDTKVIYDRIETEEENNYIDEVSNDKAIKCGNYFSKEKKLTLD